MSCFVSGWLWVMGVFTVWRWMSWIYGFIVNDMIFAYNIVMFIAWFVFNVINPFAFACIHSLYLELNDLTKIQDLAKLKVVFFSQQDFVSVASQNIKKNMTLTDGHNEFPASFPGSQRLWVAPHFSLRKQVTGWGKNHAVIII